MDNWIIVLISLIFSAIFSGLEIAFVSSNKLQIELDKNKGLFSAKILSSLVNNPSGILGALLLGNNIALVIYGIAMANILEPVIANILTPQYSSEFLILIIQTFVSTILILIAAEFIPKALFRINPNAILGRFAIPIKIFYWLFYPFIFLLVTFAEFILKKIFRLSFSSEGDAFSPVDFDNYLNEITEISKEEHDVKQEIQMLQNAIEFKNIKLRECMVPRTEIAALEEETDIKELNKIFIESGHSKILIYRNSIDVIIGFVHSSDMFKKPESIKEIIHEIPIVPETMLANNVLAMFIKEHKSIAVVVDEFGGTSGVVSLEDVIEEIFGEIEDEYDSEDLTEKKINENEYLFSARLEIDYINEKYDLDLPESDNYETLGGLIIDLHESIPQVNDEIRHKWFRFYITQASESRIEQVKMIVEK